MSTKGVVPEISVVVTWEFGTPSTVVQDFGAVTSLAGVGDLGAKASITDVGDLGVSVFLRYVWKIRAETPGCL